MISDEVTLLLVPHKTIHSVVGQLAKYSETQRNGFQIGAQHSKSWSRGLAQNPGFSVPIIAQAFDRFFRSTGVQSKFK